MQLDTPVALPGLAALALGYVLFLLSLLVARLGRDSTDSIGGARAPASRIGIAVQAGAIALTGFGPIQVTLDPLSPRALAQASAILLLMLACVALFTAAARAMGRNWSITARTRADHQLVQHGPFARLRHPIYTALFLMMAAIALAFGHLSHLLLTVPLYALGTWLRIGHEERLLRAQFGPAYEAYAERVKRFVPGVF